jgi:MYXO-CTERM domain-containing protein
MARSSWCLATLWICCTFGLGHAHAGPVELFDAVSLEPGMPNTIVSKYMYGGSGLLISHDSGKNFSLVCNSSVDPNAARDTGISSFVSGTGAIYVGGFSGMWRGDENGCGFAAVPDLASKYVTTIVGDVLEPNRTYATTSNGADSMGNPAKNGILTNDGTSASWTALGTQEPFFIQTLHVVKKDSAERFYETKVQNIPKTDPMTGMPGADDVHYYARFSDDKGTTWTEHEFTPVNQFGPQDDYANFGIIAVDPQNPDHIYAAVTRTELPDDLLYSPSRGEAGSWIKIATVTDMEAIAFAPDGTVYFGDNDQTTPGLFKFSKPGDMPTQLSSAWKVGCLHWDDSQKRMLACHDWQFGTADLTSGAFSALYDMRCGQTFQTCPGEDMASVCQTQLLAAWCNISHYPAAPLCASYMVDGAADFIHTELDFDCVNGFTVPRASAAGAGAPAGAGGASLAGAGGMSLAAGGASALGGSGLTGGVTGAAGASAVGSPAAASGGAAPSPAASKSGGCSVTATGATSSSMFAGWAFLGLFALAYRRRR